MMRKNNRTFLCLLMMLPLPVLQFVVGPKINAYINAYYDVRAGMVLLWATPIALLLFGAGAILLLRPIIRSNWRLLATMGLLPPLIYGGILAGYFLSGGEAGIFSTLVYHLTNARASPYLMLCGVLLGCAYEAYIAEQAAM